MIPPRPPSGMRDPPEKRLLSMKAFTEPPLPQFVNLAAVLKVIGKPTSLQYSLRKRISSCCHEDLKRYLVLPLLK